MALISSNRLVVFDLETTGLDTERDAVIQIGAVAIDQCLREVSNFEVKVRFDHQAASPLALQVNSFKEGTWEREAVSEREAACRFAAFLKENATLRRQTKNGKPFFVAEIAAYNASFDGPFLHAWYERMGEFLPASFLAVCIMQRVQWFFLESPERERPVDLKLQTVAKFLGVKLSNAHDALSDSRASANVYREILFRTRRQAGRAKRKKL